MTASPARVAIFSAGRLQVRLSHAERTELEVYARAESLTLAQAVRRLVRLGLHATHNNGARRRTRHDASTTLPTELLLHLLIAQEQVIKLVENITPRGPGSADELLVEAGQAAQRRLARGHENLAG